ncbi:MAG: hypothetical protein ACHREM_24865 [Polyangiales bacterium]
MTRTPPRWIALGSIACMLACACSSASLTVAASGEDSGGDGGADTSSDAVVADVADVAIDSGPPLDISGTWSGTVTNQSAGCPGAPAVGQSSALQTAIVETGTNVTVTVSGIVGLFFSAQIGGDTLTGTLSGSHLVTTLDGTKQQKDGNCLFTWTVSTDLHATTSSIVGTVTYTPNLGTGTDCARYSGCSNAQRLTLAPGISDAATSD